MDSDCQKELTCFVCLNYLTDPITIDCGHSFCRHCLNLIWEKGTTAHCPICKEKTVQTELKTNILVKNLVFLARQAHLRQFLCSQEQMCGTHKETKTIFCEVSRNLFCVLCSNIQEHESHTHYSIEYAIEDYQEKLLRQMRSIWKKIQENEINLKKESQITKDWRCFVDVSSYMFTCVHRTFPPILFDESQHLKVLESEGKNSYKQLIKSEAAMEQKKKDLREMYEDLMTMCHKSDVELLKSFEDLLTRSEFVQQHMPQPVNPALNARPIPGLIEKVKQFQVNILFEYETCSKNCMLFEDVRHRSDLQDVPFHSSRSNCFPAWEAQEFTSGKHYWEIDVNNSYAVSELIPLTQHAFHPIAPNLL
ncbi:PREDICTED: tripartite motif-containing protein 43-like [Chrysochloris asiatica]|uniref:Tripartite motif-containing protein 43-like n=1 Tax=Chrysochloris asiatica TaxID=185453 RepID=A0A9B0TYY3_CHRAS|nr:PREDICTED: tripartite motif-containing protein 43-like [Chrysochloris asiatica]